MKRLDCLTHGNAILVLTIINPPAITGKIEVKDDHCKSNSDLYQSMLN